VPAFSKILLKRFRAKWTRFAWEARQFASIGADAAGQDALQQPAIAFAGIA
jgi:hypothetical protein